MTTNCSKCGRPFVMGKNGIETPSGDQCDSCAGVARAIDGTVIETTVEHCCCFEIMGDNPECPIHGKAS